MAIVSFRQEAHVDSFPGTSFQPFKNTEHIAVQMFREVKSVVLYRVHFKLLISHKLPEVIGWIRWGAFHGNSCQVKWTSCAMRKANIHWWLLVLASELLLVVRFAAKWLRQIVKYTFWPWKPSTHLNKYAIIDRISVQFKRDNNKVLTLLLPFAQPVNLDRFMQFSIEPSLAESFSCALYGS